MTRVLCLMLIALSLSACQAASGPSLEGPDGETIEFEAIPDVDYRASGPITKGPDGPPNQTN